MVALAPAVRATAVLTRAGTRPLLALPWLLMLGSAWLVAGIFLDGWAHNHGKADSFFTPWHAVLYSGYAASAAVVLASLRRTASGTASARWVVPAGYGVSLVGVIVFGLAGMVGLLLSLLVVPPSTEPVV
jgi:hypothetical protein